MNSKARISLEVLRNDNPNLWEPVYWHPDRHDSNQKLMLSRLEHLEKMGLPAEDVAKSEGHVDKSFGVFRGNEESPFTGPYAFIAPTRIERDSKLDYTNEARGPYPAISHLQQDAAQVFLSAQSPCILDYYGEDSNNPNGVMVFAPLFMDMLKDYEADSLLADPNFVTEVMNATVAFARDRAGVKYAGLAAVLPALTNFGQSITEKGVELSTGHAGTVWAMEESALKVIEEGLGDVAKGDIEQGLTIVGLGGIGLSTAVSLRRRYSNIPLHVYDSRQKAIDRARTQLNGSVVYHSSLQEAMNTTRLTLSAVTGQLDLAGVNKEGLVVVDDSQPGSVDQDSLRESGGFVVGVYTDGGPMTTRNLFDYAGRCAVRDSETFSCHANVAAVAAEAGAGSSVTELCFRRPVEPVDVARVAELFKKHNVKVAPLQWGWGKYHSTS
jgi:hypothetical protein